MDIISLEVQWLFSAIFCPFVEKDVEKDFYGVDGRTCC